jgi:hypothetical protein
LPSAWLRHPEATGDPPRVTSPRSDAKLRSVLAAAGTVAALAGGLVVAFQLVSSGPAKPGAGQTLSVGVSSPQTTGDGATDPGDPPAPPGPPGPAFRDPVDAALAGLRGASAVFNAPSTLTLHEQTEIQLLVSAGQSIEKLKGEITAPGPIEAARVEVSPVMIATLSGTGFSIDPDEESEQVVAKSGFTTWSWDIEPIKTGTQYLRLRLFAVISFEGSEKRYMVKRFERTLAVNVAWSERVSGFFKDNWQWLWTALLIPIVGFLWGRRKREEGKAGKTTS